MKNEEALKTLRYEIEEEGHCSYIEEEMKLAMNALEKQIPKKPIKKNPIVYAKTIDGKARYSFDYYCPFCGVIPRLSDHHCICGQALDWGESE